MAPPLPTVTQQGQGVVGADQLNTYVQTVQNFAQLRTFAALDDMCVMALGGAAEGDGSQGLFWYDATSTAADNNTTVIVPTGNLQGAWLLLPPGSNSPGNFASLTVSGNATIGGNLAVGGTLSVTGVASFAADILMTGTGEIEIPAGTTGQRSASPVAGMIRYNTSLSQFEGYGASWSPLAGTGVAFPPGGRLTLTSGVPVLSATVTAASGLIYTPYVGATVPQWNGSAWSSTTFAEISQSLSDTVNSPAAAVSASVYDLFVWFKSGVATLSRGPVWTNVTTRAQALSRVQGFLVNSLSITNGPAAGYGLWVGTIMTDTSAAAVTFAPNPAAAVGGPFTGSGGGNSGAWVGLCNAFNRVSLTAVARDSSTSWTYATATWRQADNAPQNRISFVVGFGVAGSSPEDSIFAGYTSYSTTASSQIGYIGVGINSTSSPSGQVASNASSTDPNSQTAAYAGVTSAGQQYVQALEYAAGATITTVGSTAVGQLMQLVAQLRF